LDDVFFVVVLSGDKGVDVAEGVVERDVPGHGEVGVGAHEEGGVVVVGRLHDGCHDLFAGGFGAGFDIGVFVEGVVVDAVRDLGAPGGAVAVEEFFLFLPKELVVFAAGAVDVVGAERGGVVEYKVFEEGGTAVDREVGPTEGVAGEVVAHVEGEAFDKGDFAGAVYGVFAVGDFHFKVVADVDADATGASISGAAVEALFEDGVAVDIACVVGVGLPPAEFGVAEVGAVVEGDGGIDDVADGFDGAEFEVEHAVDSGGEGGVERDVAVGTESADGIDGGFVVVGVVGFADGGPVPAFVVAGRVGPVEVFEYFDGEAQGDGVVDAVLHAGEGGQFEEVGVLGGDVVVG